MNTKFIPTHGLDCGANGSTLYSVATGKVEKISHGEVLNLPERLPKNSKLLCEYSHLGCERTEFSLSQPYDRHQLLDLYKRFDLHGVELRLFPQKSTPRAAGWAERWKDDMNDPYSICRLVMDFPEISLMKPPKSFDLDHKRKWSYEIKKYLNRDINKARREKPIAYYSDFVCQLLRKKETLQFLNDNLDDIAKSCFGFTWLDKKKGVTTRRDSIFTQRNPNKYPDRDVGDIHLDKVKFQALYPLFASMINPETRDWRVRDDGRGEFITLGVNYIKQYVLCMSPFHLKGGVARSNLYYHGMKNWIIAEAALDGFDLAKKCRGGFLDEDARKLKKNKQLVYPLGKIKEGTRFTPEEDAYFVEKRQQYSRAIKDVLHLVKQIGEKEISNKESIITTV